MSFQNTSIYLVLGIYFSLVQGIRITSAGYSDTLTIRRILLSLNLDFHHSNSERVSESSASQIEHFRTEFVIDKNCLPDINTT